MKWYYLHSSRHSSVGIETKLQDGQQRNRGWMASSRSKRFIPSPTRPDRLCGTPKSPIHWILGAVTQGVQRPQREADHLPPSSAVVTNKWSYIPTPLHPYAFMACTGASSLTFTLYVNIIATRTTYLYTKRKQYFPTLLVYPEEELIPSAHIYYTRDRNSFGELY